LYGPQEKDSIAVNLGLSGKYPLMKYLLGSMKMKRVINVGGAAIIAAVLATSAAAQEVGTYTGTRLMDKV
jgi:hypothetical protein